MSEAEESSRTARPQRKLSEVVREVKNAIADRDDVVVEMREAQRGRLEILAQELAQVIEEIPADDPSFDLAISSGLQPRFWIDAVAHVAMGRDRRLYRFIRATRNGPVVLAESHDVKVIAEAVTRYIAERIVERERMLEGTVTALPRGQPHGLTQPRGGGWRAFWTGFLLVLLGAAAGVAVLLVMLRDRLPAIELPF
jgi:hypothetical protein